MQEIFLKKNVNCGKHALKKFNLEFFESVSQFLWALVGKVPHYTSLFTIFLFTEVAKCVSGVLL
jgi:hypothetical protein